MSLEEKQIIDFVQRVSKDENLRTELTAHPDVVLSQESFTPTVQNVLRKLIPQLALVEEKKAESCPKWWD